MTTNDPQRSDTPKVSVLGFTQHGKFGALPTPDSGTTAEPVMFDDFTIDGTPLYQILFPDFDPGNATSFDASWPEGAVNAANELLGLRKPELDDGRVPLYVCPLCADLGCGALTVDVEHADNTVVWKHPGWQTNYEDGWEVGDYKHLADIAPFVFNKDQYTNALTEIRERYAAMPPRPTPEKPKGLWSRLRNLLT